MNDPCGFQCLGGVISQNRIRVFVCCRITLVGKKVIVIIFFHFVTETFIDNE